MAKFFAILLVAVVAAKAYDFSDLEYNQMLFDEFEFLNEEVFFTRSKRDAAPAERKECAGGHRGEVQKDFMCCTGDKFDPEHVKKAKGIKKQCAMKLRANNSDVKNFDPFDCEKMGRIKQLIICEGECIARALNILTEDGKLNREVIIERLAEHMVGEIEWKKAAYEGYVDKCLAQVEAGQEQEADQQCNSAPMEFHHCVWGEFINGCPADLRINSPKCNKMREFHSQGNSNLFNKYLLKSFLFRDHEHRGHSAEQKERE